ncbi:MAG: lipid-A-disaccharide synthase [Calditrichaeota bacterium]|nr:lipid-A-disaccharide synthase [Calditrichota bacterium]
MNQEQSTRKRTIFIIAGEASGDRHAADLVQALLTLQPEWRFTGIGGDRMQQAGVELIYHLSQLAFLGIAEVIRHLPTILRVQKGVRRRLEAGVDAVILVDYPGFNLHIARMAHGMGIPVIYYICPQLWAWGQKRVEKIRKYVDLPLVIFKFEESFFARFGIQAHWVGHPLVDQLTHLLPEEAFREKYGLAPDQRIIALLPGSREMEVRQLLPVMIAAVQELARTHRIVPIVGKPEHLEMAFYRQLVPDSIRIIDQDVHALMKHAHFALVASGTATLELGYLQTPMVVMYRVAPLTYYLGRLLIQLDHIALANIVAGKPVVPELIQHHLTVERVQQYARKYLEDERYYIAVKSGLASIPEVLGPPGASERAARRIVDFLNRSLT